MRLYSLRVNGKSGTGFFGLLAVLILFCSITFGVYVGFWVCLVGGITTIIEQIKATNVDSWVLGLAIAKVLGCSVCGFVAAIPGFILSAVVSSLSSLKW
jgi:hypothetical protein